MNFALPLILALIPASIVFAWWLDSLEQSRCELSDRQGGGIFKHGEVMDNG